MVSCQKIFIVFFCAFLCLAGMNSSSAQEDDLEQRETDTLSSFESRISAIIQENVILKKKLKELEGFSSSPAAGASLALENKLHMLQEKNDSLAVQLEEKNKESGVLQEQAASLRKDAQAKLIFQDKLKLLEEESHSLRARLEERNKENDGLKTEVSELKNEVTANLGQKGALDKLKEENNQLQEKIASLQGEITAKDLERTILEAMLRRQPEKLRHPGAARGDEGNLDKIIHLNMGFAYGMKGNIDEAIREYQEALAYDADDKDIHYNLGYLLSKKNNDSEAIKEYKKAIKRLPQDKEVYYNMALIYALGLKDIKTAQEYHQKFLSLSSDNGSVIPHQEAAVKAH